MKLLVENRNKLLELAPQPMNGGKQGSIFVVLNEPTKLAKIHKTFTPEMAKRFAFLINNRPQGPSLAWPENLLLDPTNGEPRGLLLPRVIDAFDLSKFSNPLRRPAYADERFRFGLCQQLANAVAAVHRKRYILGDLNSVNTLVTAQGDLVLVDLDSAQFTTGGTTYLCEVGCAEFTPPEFQTIRGYASTARTAQADCFALAVLCFQILLGGHPFQAVFADPRQATELRERIRLGLWPYRVPAIPGLSPPPGMPPFDHLHPHIQEHFRRCFAEGHGDPTLRPSAQDWSKALDEAIRDLFPSPAPIPACPAPAVTLTTYFQKLRVVGLCHELVTRIAALRHRRLLLAVSALALVLILLVRSRSGQSNVYTPGPVMENSWQLQVTPPLWRRFRGEPLVPQEDRPLVMEDHGPLKETPRLWQELRGDNISAQNQ